MSFSNRLTYALALAPLVALGACSEDPTGITNTAGQDSGGLPATDGGAAADADSRPVQGIGTDVKIPGLTAPVTAAYDVNGFLHVSGKTDNDAFSTVGYFHAANRFFFMDFLRNAVRGTLGTKVTVSSLIAQDLQARLFFADPKTGNPLPDVLYAQLDDANKAIFEAYAAGVNAWINDLRNGKNGAKLSEEYAFTSSAITDWLPSDSYAVLLYFLNDLSNPAQQEIALGQVAAALPSVGNAQLAGSLATLFLDFTSTYDIDAIDAANGTVASLTPGKKTKSKLGRPSLDLSKALAMAADNVRKIPGTSMHKDPGDTGSNNWVIGGSHTTSGRPIVANDPHLSILNPSLWFPVEIDGKTGGTGTYHVAGGSFPGLPTVQTGHNENLAWGVTVSFWDLADAYIETLTAAPGANATTPGSVLFNSASVPMIAKDITFMEAGLPVVRTLRWVPQHGPVVGHSGSNLVTIRWRGLDGTNDISAFLGLGRATNLAEAKTALSNATSANQNFVIADKNGDIGYYPFSKVPGRPWAADAQASTSAPRSVQNPHDPTTQSPFFPVIGTGQFEWGAPVATADMPQVTNPAGGFVATANGDINGAFRQNTPLAATRVTSDGTPTGRPLPIQTWGHAEGTREERIVQTLKANGTTNSIDTSIALQGDTKSLPAVTIVPAMLAAVAAGPAGGFNAADPGTAAAISALTAWSQAGAFTCPAGIDGLDPAGAKTADATVARESIGCSTFHVALYALFDGAFGDELASPNPAVLAMKLSGPSAYTNFEVKVLVKALSNLTTAPSAPYWFDSRVTDHNTTMHEILQRAVTKAGAVLTAAYGASTDDWRWGRFHTGAEASLLPSSLGFDSAAYPLQGGLYTVNVANPGTVTLDGTTTLAAQFRPTSGPSLRTQIEVGTDRPRMKFVYAGGADGHRTGRFYNNLLPAYLANTPVDFPFGADFTAPVASVTINAAVAAH